MARVGRSERGWSAAARGRGRPGRVSIKKSRRVGGTLPKEGSWRRVGVLCVVARARVVHRVGCVGGVVAPAFAGVSMRIDARACAIVSMRTKVTLSPFFRSQIIKKRPGQFPPSIYLSTCLWPTNFIL